MVMRDTGRFLINKQSRLSRLQQQVVDACSITLGMPSYPYRVALRPGDGKVTHYYTGATDQDTIVIIGITVATVI
jgi:hypothetical protein